MRCSTLGAEAIAATAFLTHLDEADILGVLTEALAADVEAVLADQTPVVGAHTAAGKHRATLRRKTGQAGLC